MRHRKCRSNATPRASVHAKPRATRRSDAGSARRSASSGSGFADTPRIPDRSRPGEHGGATGSRSTRTTRSCSCRAFALDCSGCSCDGNVERGRRHLEHAARRAGSPPERCNASIVPVADRDETQQDSHSRRLLDRRQRRSPERSGSLTVPRRLGLAASITKRRARPPVLATSRKPVRPRGSGLSRRLPWASRSSFS